MKLRSILLLGGTALVGLVVLGFYFVYSNLDGIVKNAIEHYGSEVMGTSVRVGDVSISPTAGTGRIERLRIEEPGGFGGGDVISFKEIELGIDIRSLTQRKPIVIDLIRVIAPSVNYVVNAQGGSNLSTLQGNISRYTRSGKKEPAPKDENNTPLLISVRRLVIEDGQVSADLSAVGLESQHTALPAIRAENLGGTKGAPPSEIAVALAQKLVADTLVAVGRSQIAPQVGRMLKQAVGQENAENIQGVLQGLLKK